jgi:hypothetical protein
MPKQVQLAPPVISRRAEVAAGGVFDFAGRSLLVRKAYGSDPAAPVIVEELASFGPKVLAGQLSIWSNDAVLRAMFPPRRR